MPAPGGTRTPERGREQLSTRILEPGQHMPNAARSSSSESVSSAARQQAPCVGPLASRGRSTLATYLAAVENGHRC